MKRVVRYVFSGLFVPLWVAVTPSVLAFTDQAEEELFGAGLSTETLKSKAWKHLSSSTEDLTTLFQMEQSLLQHLIKLNSTNSLPQVALQYLENIEHLKILVAHDASEYVRHPINAFHLLRRLSQSGLKEFLASKEAEDLLGLGPWSHMKLPEERDFLSGATFGILNLQIFHKLNIDDVAKGMLIDPITEQKYQSVSGLSLYDIIKIADRASGVWRLDAAVQWLEYALSTVSEKETKKLQAIRTKLEQSKKLHDNYILENGFLTTMTPPGEEICVVYTQKQLYDRKLQRNDQRYSRHKGQHDVYAYETKMFENLSKLDGSEEAAEADKSLPFKLTYYMDETMKKLCRGQDKDIRSPEYDIGLRCLLLHRNDPYLKLGPFRYETLHGHPHVGLLHNFVTEAETQQVQSIARGKMKSTPLMVQKANEDYTRLRTSKVMYMNDTIGIAQKLSNRINLAMNFNVNGEKYAAENYQVMNYGIGGSITPHLDSSGILDPAYYNNLLDKGGDRITTFMVYLTSVESGGRTVFPQIGLSVEPQLGNALFWFNLDSASKYDTRNFHVGCPVIYGNKWIANKWVKEFAQWKHYYCRPTGEAFKSFSNNEMNLVDIV